MKNPSVLLEKKRISEVIILFLEGVRAGLEQIPKEEFTKKQVLKILEEVCLLYKLNMILLPDLKED